MHVLGDKTTYNSPSAAVKLSSQVRALYLVRHASVTRSLIAMSFEERLAVLGAKAVHV